MAFNDTFNNISVISSAWDSNSQC